jgi:hypothetical protein
LMFSPSTTATEYPAIPQGCVSDPTPSACAFL